MTYKLGKKPARPDAIKFKFGSYFDRSKLPVPPMVFGHERIGYPWGMLANDEYSDCVLAGAAHETMVWRYEGGKPVAHFSDANVLSDYSALTGFDPNNLETDQGTDMQEAASYRRKTGIIDSAGNRHKVDSYVAIKTDSTDDLAVATYLCGAVGVGLEFPDYAMKQFDHHMPWDVVKNAPQPQGGHYVPCIGRNSHGNFLIVTWGRIQAMTPAFYLQYCDEAVAYISSESLQQSLLTPEGFDAAGLANSLRQLST